MTTHFTIAEIESHRLCHKHGLPLSENRIPVHSPVNSPISTVAEWKLACDLLEQARARLGAPIVISCGYRSPRLNTAAGGVPTSQHQGFYNQKNPGGSRTRIQSLALDLQAADIDRLAEIMATLPHDQILIETSGSTRWIHWSWNPYSRNRGQFIPINL